MKIASISDEESGERWIAFKTEPRLTESIFEKYIVLHRCDPILSKFKANYRAETCSLILESETSIASVFPEGFIPVIERLLSSAESLLNAEAAQRKEYDTQKEKKRKSAIQEVAKKLGIPIK
ncbi:MAG: hypothetical protein ABSF51_14005 [Verrucomicrobiota bacterium]|jgi:hypothetical protein